MMDRVRLSRTVDMKEDGLAMKSMSGGLLAGVVAAGILLTSVVPQAIAATTPPAAAPAAAPAASATPSPLGTFKAWTAWKGTDANGPICYISSDPSTSLPDGAKRDPVHFLVINRKATGTKNEVQTLIGYPFKKDSKPTATIDSKSYAMVVEGAAAWLASTGDEPGFVAALKSGTKLVVKGTSQRGTETTDTYVLSGVTAALAAADKACS
jgi:Invasion associated locus B (IalB) protein